MSNSYTAESFAESFAEALEREKLESLKELAYGAGHEINNPLANISAQAQMLLRDERDPERRRRLAAINSQAFRAHEMIADLMLFARPPRLQCEPTEIGKLVDAMLAELEPEATAREVALRRGKGDAEVQAEIDPVQLSVALRAICMNGLEAIGHAGSIEISADSDDEFANIYILDDGPGISPEIRRHLFDPFYSGREAGRGLGFGLCKCWRIVTDHGGTIDVDSPASGGAVFHIRLPRSAGATP